MAVRTMVVVVLALALALALAVGVQGCKEVTPGRWMCAGAPGDAGAATAAVAAVRSQLGADALACLAWPEAAEQARGDPLRAAYDAEVYMHLSTDDAAALDRLAAAAATTGVGADAFLWLNAIYALHSAAPRVVRFAPACLPLVRYADDVETELPLGVFVLLPPASMGEVLAARPAARALLDRYAQRGWMAVAGAPAGGLNETSRCNATAERVECTRLEGSVFLGVAERSFLWQTPLGVPPARGWPVAVHYHGSFGAPHVFSWASGRNYPYGLYWQTLTVKQLLDTGYAVITPESHFAGFFFWDTNVPVYRTYWEISPDHAFVTWLLAEMAAPAGNGTFGPLDPARFYATGLSSGAYMTSRMAANYQGRFRALAIHSGSYATCAGPICSVPDPLPAGHPPTLFLHGEADLIVNIRTMWLYAEQMAAQGLVYATAIDPDAGHEWTEQAVQAVPAWFDAYP
jgi:poly(3-hydroxyoctanoate) depolymerase